MKGFHLPIFAVALLASLLLHAAVWTTTHELPVRPGSIAVSGSRAPRPESFTITLNARGEPKEEFTPDDLAKPEDARNQVEPEGAPPPAVVPPPPAPPVKPDVERFPDRIGRQDGEGIGTHEAKGAKPLLARTATNDQPFLSRDPQGPGLPRDPAQSLLPPGDGGSGGKPAAMMPAPQAVAAPMPVPRAMEPVEHVEKGAFRPGPIVVKIPAHQDGIESEAKKIDEQAQDQGPLAPAKPGVLEPIPTPTPSAGPPKETGPRAIGVDQRMEPNGLALPPPPPPAKPATSPPPAPLPMRVPPTAIAALISPATPAITSPALPAAQSVARPGDGGRPGAPSPAADPAQESDSEVDAFSKLETVLRRDGKMDVQFGRQVKTVRPRIPISGLIDAALGARSVTLKIHIGIDGNVTAASVVKSSGSNELDQPTLVAIYDWWFEPLKDKKGQPVPDVIFFKVTFR